MRKVIGFFGVLLVLFVGAIIIIATVDFNRLGKDHIYVQIAGTPTMEETKLNSGEIMREYWYTLPAYKEDGEMIEIEFSASKELRDGAYLMLYVKNGDEVSSYDEVELSEIPQKAKEKLEQ